MKKVAPNRTAKRNESNNFQTNLMSLCLAQSGHSNKQNINSLGNNKQATRTVTAKIKLLNHYCPCKKEVITLRLHMCVRINLALVKHDLYNRVPKNDYDVPSLLLKHAHTHINTLHSQAEALDRQPVLG